MKRFSVSFFRRSISMDRSRVLFYNNLRNIVVVICCTFSFLLVLRLSTAFYLVYPHLQGNKVSRDCSLS